MTLPRTRLWLLPQVSWISDREIRRLALAMALVMGEVAHEYDAPEPTVDIASREADIPDDGNPCLLSPTIDQPGDAAYHWVRDGRPFSLVLALPDDLGGTQMAALHEGIEEVADPFCDRYVVLDDGTHLPIEPADPTQGDAIPIDLGDGGDPIRSSNWVFQAWFRKNVPAGTRLDRAGLITKSRTIRDGGYEQLVDPSGRVRIVGTLPEAYKRDPRYFRHGKRLASLHSLAKRIRAKAA